MAHGGAVTNPNDAANDASCEPGVVHGRLPHGLFLEPFRKPTGEPTGEPNGQPNGQPSRQPGLEPSILASPTAVAAAILLAGVLAVVIDGSFFASPGAAAHADAATVRGLAGLAVAGSIVAVTSIAIFAAVIRTAHHASCVIRMMYHANDLQSLRGRWTVRRAIASARPQSPWPGRG